MGIETKQLPLRLAEPEKGRFIVTKSSKLIQAQSTLTAREQKLLSAAIAQINPMHKYEGDLCVRLTSNEICRLTGISSTHIHDFLFKAADSIMNAKFIYANEENPDQFEKMTIAPHTMYKDKMFTITFSARAKNELIQLSRYASYELKQIENLQTKYSIRLFELFSDAYHSKRRGKQKATFFVDDLFFRLGITDQKGNELAKGYINRFSKFRQRILEPSIIEINKKTELNIEIAEDGYRRIGRKIGEIQFTIRQISGNSEIIEDVDLETAFLKMEVPDKKIAQWKKLAAISPSVENEESTIEEYLIRSIQYMNEAMENGLDILNQVGFMDHLIKNFIVDAPAWADPHSSAYKGKQIEQAFVKQYFIGQYQFIEQDIAAQIAKHGIMGSSFQEQFLSFQSNYKKSN